MDSGVHGGSESSGLKCAARRGRLGPLSLSGAGASRRGQALVELALVAMILSLLLLGIIELVLLYTTRTDLTDAARTGVRNAALAYQDTTITRRTMQVMNAHGLNTAHNGVCDIQELDIYRANSDGSVYPGPNSVESMKYVDVNNTCVPQLVYPGFPLSERESTTAVNGIPMNVGVQILYRYYLKTPVLSAFGSYVTINARAILALGEDNANNFLNMATSTPVPTFTPSNTPTVTSTPTNTPLVAPTATPLGSFTPTATPLPAPAQVTYSMACSGGNQYSPPGIRVEWSEVPGATGYVLEFNNHTTTSVVATLSGVDSTIYPDSSPPYYDVTVPLSSTWLVYATYGAAQSPPTSSQPVPSACGLPSG